MPQTVLVNAINLLFWSRSLAQQELDIFDRKEQELASRKNKST